jgi:putative ABC transport system permease protein
MNILVTLRVALRALMRNKVRSLLTMLGIIIGIAAVIAMIAIGQGATVMMQDQMRSMGDNLLMVFPGSASKGGMHFGMGTNSTLTPQDSDALMKESNYIKAISPVNRSNGQLIYQEKNWAADIQGVATSYLAIGNWKMDKGGFFTDSDVRGATKVCVLGATTTKQLFEDEDPTGKILRIKNMPFRILGVLGKKGSNAMGHDQDDIVMVPWTTVRRVFQKTIFNNINQIVMSLKSVESLEQAKSEITAILRERHRLAPGADDDFSLMAMTELNQMITSTSRLMTILLTAIASISLIVGGIGIMNIMLVSVTERTREIGLRMAVGARNRDILLQFLVEAIVLAGIGGIWGILLGVGSAQIVTRINNWPVSVSVTSVLLAFFFSAAVGIFFGFFPAWRASRLNPIEALRYE